jgi:hypothetical protein
MGEGEGEGAGSCGDDGQRQCRREAATPTRDLPQLRRGALHHPRSQPTRILGLVVSTISQSSIQEYHYHSRSKRH